MRNLATPETQSNLALVTFGQKALDIAHLDVVVALVSAWTELDLFDLDNRLLCFRFRRFLLLLVLELAVIHQTTDRRNRRGRNFNQVNIQLTRHTQRLHEACLLYTSDAADE